MNITKKFPLFLALIVATVGLSMSFFAPITKASEYTITAHKHWINQDGVRDSSYAFDIAKVNVKNRADIKAPIIPGFHLDTSIAPIYIGRDVVVFNYNKDEKIPDPVPTPPVPITPVPSDNKPEPKPIPNHDEKKHTPVVPIPVKPSNHHDENHEKGNNEDHHIPLKPTKKDHNPKREEKVEKPSKKQPSKDRLVFPKHPGHTRSTDGMISHNNNQVPDDHINHHLRKSTTNWSEIHDHRVTNNANHRTQPTFKNNKSTIDRRHHSQSLPRTGEKSSWFLSLIGVVLLLVSSVWFIRINRTGK